jgi:hypothetical protein
MGRILALSIPWLISVITTFGSASASAGSPVKYAVTAVISPETASAALDGFKSA